MNEAGRERTVMPVPRPFSLLVFVTNVDRDGPETTAILVLLTLSLQVSAAGVAPDGQEAIATHAH